jgi:triosephosphate isomerase
MRTPIIAGNWKMHYTHEEAASVAAELARLTADAAGAVEVVVAPTATSLASVAAALQGTHVLLSAQNMHAEDKGAFTGEVSAPMIKALGCKYVILGHSERRQLFGETDAGVRRKVGSALAASLTPIICVGELLEEREADKTAERVEAQTLAALEGLSAEQVSSLVIAYEPVWAIGTGKTATPAQAQEVHALIRALVSKRYGAEAAGALRIQYGGSVKPDNAAELMACDDIDGALVGGASLKADSFAAIIAAARPL